MGIEATRIADNQASLAYFVPELIVIAGILFLFLSDIWARRKSLTFQERWQAGSAFVIGALALLALLLGVGSPLGESSEAVSLFNGLMVHDRFAWFFRAFALVTTLVVVPIVPGSRQIDVPRLGEFYALMYCITLGLMTLPGSVDLLMIFLSLELISLMSYILTAYRKGVRLSAEGGLKYVIFGGVASGTMLYGFSLLYGVCGGTTLADLNAGFHDVMKDVYIQDMLGDPTALKVTLAVAVVFVLVGFGYKIAAAPFHLWTPDAYEGAPTPFTAFLSVGPKAAGMAVIIRFFFGVFVDPDPALWTKGIVESITDLPWQEILAILSIATMTVGNLSALTQSQIKRMLAFSSIAHAGYMLMGLAVGTTQGLEAVLVYTVIYLFMNLGAFIVATWVEAQSGSDEIETYRGLAARAPLASLAMAIFLFSLTGLPPLAGFIGKFLLFYAVLAKGGALMWTLALIGALNGAISLYYYARVVKAMYLDAAVEHTRLRLGTTYGLLTLLLLLPTLAFGVYWSPLARLGASALHDPMLSKVRVTRVASLGAAGRAERLTQLAAESRLNAP